MTNFPWDIVLLALLAVAMAGTLFCVLGRRIGAQGLKQESSPAVNAHESRRTDEQNGRTQPPPLPSQVAPEEARIEYAVPSDHSALSEEVRALQQRLPGFTAEGFLRQTEVFFREIVAALTRADLPFLQARLTPEAFEVFKTLIETRQKEGHQAFCDIRRIERLEYKEVVSVAPDAGNGETGSVYIKVAIISWQISNLKDDKKNIVEGTEALTEFHDLWGILCPLQGGGIKLASAAVF
ncbi:Tim44/TimA family putative adaptor protein [Acetobacteraceae bacterium ESL0709]|nr:Tim44/TimA family putative adaptor protein [Acetobacteraceae bacterium ESL0697]MDF7677808.1 Tim44/TimA family putative adaptor protein [Acetobacteraceae bacterium ESL0709]